MVATTAADGERVTVANHNAIDDEAVGRFEVIAPPLAADYPMPASCIGFTPTVIFERIDGPSETAYSPEDVARILAAQQERAVLARRRAASPPFKCSSFCHDGCTHGVTR